MSNYLYPSGRSVGKPNVQDIQEGAYPEEKKKSVAGQFAAVKYRPETYGRTQKLNREDYGVDKYWYFFFSRLDLKLAG